MADLRAFKRLDGEDTALEMDVLLWRLQRKEPGCVVGEHMQVLRWDRCAGRGLWRGMPTRDWPGEAGRSRENLTVAADGDVLQILTRVGEADRWKKVEDGEAKVEDEKAKADDEEE